MNCSAIRLTGTFLRLLTVIVTLGFFNNVFAFDPPLVEKDELGRKCEQAYLEKNDPILQKECAPEAEKGHLGAQVYVGLRLFDQGDHATALEWLQKAALRGHPRALNALGFYSISVNRDEDTAFLYFSKAAELGEPSAQYNLGRMYFNGLGAQRNFLKAKEYYEKAAAQGYSSAQYNLGMMYEFGYGIEQRIDKALELYTEAATHNHAGAVKGIQRIRDFKL